ncbi:MAG: hypothetical protein GF317_21050 [Candidatus Lokiarchaeota archaeon]|nr:hypothetical protein [Candidatus Lokiarchaeota archaeon]MBD3201933.1 hypothetical protein [Candidatus Lokiarchaeota archaeon]
MMKSYLVYMSEKISKYIESQKSPQKEICKKLREIILNEYPKIEEKMKYGVPYYNDKFYIVGLKESVNLGFSIKNLTEEEISLFQGNGKTTRHLKIHSINEINESDIKSKLNLVFNK